MGGCGRAHIRLVLVSFIWIIISDKTDGCRFGADESCIYPCHCESGTVCNAETGDCSSGCDADNRDIYQYPGDWSGPGCQVGNMALGMPAMNGPETFKENSAGRAVDGNIDPDLNAGSSCAHPHGPDPSYAYWEVTFDKLVVLLSVTVYNRNSFRNRLENTVFEVTNTSGDYEECGRTWSTLRPNTSVVEVECGRPLRAQRLRLQRFGGPRSYTMNICEVFAIGYLYQDCSDHYFGPGCLISCNCQVSCDDVTGHCPADCISGKRGDTCQEGCTEEEMSQASDEPPLIKYDHIVDCDDRRWGVNCIEQCQCMNSGEICDKMTGSCQSGCQESWVGIGCDRQLPSLALGTTSPEQVDSTASSVTIMFSSEMVTNEPTGYLLQYRLPGADTWQNGSRLAANPTTSSNNITADNLEPNTTYDVRVVPLLDHDGLTNLGEPSPLVSATTQVSDSSILGTVLGAVLAIIAVISIIIFVFLFLRYRQRKGDKKPWLGWLKRARSDQGEAGDGGYVHPALNTESRLYVNVESPQSVEPIASSNLETSQVATTANAAGSIAKPSMHDTVDDDDDEDLDELTYEAVYDRPPAASKPIKVADLANYIQKVKSSKNNEFVVQYQALPAMQTAPWDVALLPEHRQKHRFQNIRAYDHSRVKLMNADEPDSSVYYNLTDPSKFDYINASYIKGYDNEERAYIASQGPLEASVEDMWHMVWQEDVNRIVMLANLVEQGRSKCEQYWPTGRNALSFGGYTVRLIHTETYADYTLRRFSLVYKDKSRIVHHFQFTGWPDHGVPNMATSLLEFRRKVRAQDDTATGPMLVHCSAGIGRTGTFIAIDHLMEQAKAEGQVDVKKCVMQMRMDRIKMVQNQDQYVFVYTALLEALWCGDTCMPANKVKEMYEKLHKTGGKKSKLQAQFELLGSVCLDITEAAGEPLVGMKPCNKMKNRTLDYLPANHVRPYLVTKVDGSTDYINAAYVTSYRRRNAYITTQMPLPDTVRDIWRLLHDHKSTTIIMLNQHDEHNQTSGIYWPSDVDKSLSFPPLTVKLVSESESDRPNIMVREFHITNENKKPDPLVVKQFSLAGWADEEDVPSMEDILSLTENVQSWQQNSGNGPITSQCIDGVHHSGVFVAACYILEKLKVDQEVDVFQAVKQIRMFRPQFIQNLAQYQFLYKLAICYMANNETYANFR